MRHRHKKKPEGIFNATIHTLSHEGRGIANINGKTTFIDNALPGEEVDFEYTYTKSQYDEGKATHINIASPDRVEPKCPHFALCGGCSLQHLAPLSQTRHKQQTMLDHLKHFGGIEPKEILSPITADSYGYRTKARLGVRFVTKKNRVLVGFREKYSHYLAEINSCVVLDPRVGTKITALCEMIATLSQPHTIAQIEVAAAENETALIFRHLEPLTEKDMTLLLDFANEHAFTIYLQPGGPDTIHIIKGQKANWLSYRLNNQKIELLYHPTDFTQINLAINQQMVDRAIELLALEPNDTILDLFCGLGNFTLAIASHCHHVTGVEGSSQMVERGEMNAKHNNMTNTSFYAHDLTKPFSSELWAKQPFNKLLLDPPRSGAKEVVENISAIKPDRIVYVSCNPATLARDAEILINKGYSLEKVGVLDMFPHTSHVESIGLFVKINKRRVR